MNVVMIGNGFDLANNFKTKYSDFMDYCESNLYSDGFGGLSDNFWFVYANESRKNDDWNGLESDINTCLAKIKLVLNGNQKFSDSIFSISKLRKSLFSEINICDYSHEPNRTKENDQIIAKDICRSFAFKRQLENTRKDYFISFLNTELFLFNVYLKKYLHENVNSNLSAMPIRCFNPRIISDTKQISYFLTFNYTNTLECLYNVPETKVLHIHGTLRDGIILGISSNESEDEGMTDLAFITFKKYYQRIKSNTYSRITPLYNNLIANKNSHNHLVVIGHSLDIMDREIIELLFDAFDNIIVYYHNAQALNSYIENLIKIFGAKRFEKMKITGKIDFLLLPNILFTDNG